MKYIFYTLITLATYQPLYLMDNGQPNQNAAIDDAERQLGIHLLGAPVLGEIMHEYFSKHSPRHTERTATGYTGPDQK